MRILGESSEAEMIACFLRGELTSLGQNRDVFDESFPAPADVHWTRAELNPAELAHVRYIEYSYWNELSGGTRLPIDAARRIREGVRAFDVSNQGFLAAARAVARGERFPPLILAGRDYADMVCLEGHLRLTGYALAGFPTDVGCLIGTASTMGARAQ